MDFTINFGAINLLVVFGATLAGNLLGALWYAPFVFGGVWRRSSGLAQAPQGMRNPPATFVASFVLQLVAAALLAALLGPGAGAVEGAQLGAIVAVGFVVTAMAMTNLFEKRPLTLILVNSGYHVAVLALMGLIVGAWA